MTEIEKFASKSFLVRDFGSEFGCGSSLGVSNSLGEGSCFGSQFGDGGRFGCGNGNGSAAGYGYDDWTGFGCGRGEDIKSFNNFPIYLIDDIQTGIISAKGNVAKGFILYLDLTTKPCYIVKDNNGIYAHGATLKEAEEALRAKQLKRMPVEERIQLFKEHFKSDKLYKGHEFYNWHHTLTGSCKMGRDSFCEEHGINLESEYTVKDFIELTENSYGGEIIKELRGIYEKDTDGR